MTKEEIADLLELEETAIDTVEKLLKEYPESSTAEIAQLLLSKKIVIKL